MKFILSLLLFFLSSEVNAKTIITPYLKVGEIDPFYQTNSLEKIEKVTYYKQEKINKDFKFLEKAEGEYTIKSNEIKYGEYSNYKKKKINDPILDEDIKTIYYYQDLKKIDTLYIKNINNLLIKRITLKYKDDIVYETTTLKKEYRIKLSKKYSPEYLYMEIICFLYQDDSKGSFDIEHADFIKNKIRVTTKGFNKLNIKIINSLSKLIYSNEVKKTSSLNNKFYINIIKEETLYRYRKKYFKYYKDETITSTKVLSNYKVIETFAKYYLYRKEKIEIYDNINLSTYLDLNKVIKNSTIPLKKLQFFYTNNCSNSNLIIKYQDFKINININFNCKKIPKSKVKKGKTKSVKREIFSILFEKLILKKL